MIEENIKRSKKEEEKKTQTKRTRTRKENKNNNHILSLFSYMGDLKFTHSTILNLC